MSIHKLNTTEELTAFFSQPAETAQPDLLCWLGKHVQHLSSYDLPLLQKLREEKFQNASAEKQKELKYYIKRLQPAEKEGATSPRYPYWLHKLIKAEKAPSIPSLIRATDNEKTKEDLVAFLIKTNPNTVIANIESFKIAREEKRAEFALECGKRSKDILWGNQFNNFEITDEKLVKTFVLGFVQKGEDVDTIFRDLFSLAEPLKTPLIKHCASFPTGAKRIAESMDCLRLEEESTRLELAELCLKHEEGAFAFVKNMKAFAISKEEKRIDLLKRALSFEKAACALISSLQALRYYYDISDVSAQIELVEQCAKWESSARMIPSKISALGLSGAQYAAARMRLALLCAQTKEGASAVAYYMERFEISNQWVKQKIAFLCYRHGASRALASAFGNFEFSDPAIRMRWAMRLSEDPECLFPIIHDIHSFFTYSQCENKEYSKERYLIAKRCAEDKSAAEMLDCNLKYFHLTEEENYQIIKLCIKNWGGSFSHCFRNFKFSDPAIRMRWAKRLSKNQKSLDVIAKNIRLFFTRSQCEKNEFPKERYEIAQRCTQDEAAAQMLTTYLEHFHLTEEENYQIIRLCIKKWGGPSSHGFIGFEFSDPTIRMRWAKRLSKDQGSLHFIAKNIHLFFTPSQCENNEFPQERYEIAKRCAQDKSAAQSLIANLEHFYLTPEENYAVIRPCYIKEMSRYSFSTLRQNIKLTDSQKMSLITLRSYFHGDPVYSWESGMTPQVVSELTDFPKNWSGALPLFFDMQQTGWDQTQAKTILQTFIHSHFSGSFSLYLSSMLEEIHQTSNKKSLEDNAHIRQQLLHWFSGTLFILFAEELSEKEAKWLVDQKLLSSLKGFRTPLLRLPLTYSVIRGVKQSSWREGFAHYETQLMPSERKDKNPYLEKYPYNRLFRVLLVSLKNSGIDEGILESFTKRIDQAYCKSKQRKSEHFFWETKRFGALIQILRLLADSNLNPEEKGQILQKLEKTSTNNNDLMKNLYSLLAIMNFQELKRAVKDPSVSFQELVEKLFKEKVPIGQIDNFAEKYLNTFGSSRDPRALFTYASSLSKLCDSGATQCLGDHATAVLNGTFFEERSSDKRSPTLAKIGSLFPGVKAEWLQNRLKFKLSDLVKTATTIKSPFSFHEFLKTQIVQDHHLDAETLSKLIYLSDFLNAPDLEERNRIKGDCEKALEQNKDDPFLLLQEHLFELMLTSQESEQIAALKQLIPILEKDPFTGNELLHDMRNSLKRMQEEEQNNPLSHYLVSETVDPYHLLLSGTDVSSCQRVEGDASYSKGLLDLLMNGANELVAITEISSNKIVARAILRLLWDGEKPVLFLERLYPRLDLKPEHEEALIKIAQRVAARLGIPLTRQEGTGALYGKHLHSLGGAPWCYSDATGGVQKDAIYSISNARLVK